MAALGTCARVMAALPEKAEEPEVVETVDGGVAITDAQSARPASKDLKAGSGKGGASGGGGGKKKKGKR